MFSNRINNCTYMHHWNNQNSNCQNITKVINISLSPSTALILFTNWLLSDKIIMKIICSAVIAAITILTFAQISNCSSSFSLNTNLDIENDPTFASNKENTVQRKYTILVQQKSEDCYFITDVKAGRILTVDFLVTFQIINA